MNKLLRVECPQCDKLFYYYESEFRPFCCEKCKMIDLGHWFEESYRVPSKELDPNVNQNGKKQDENHIEGQDSYEESSEDFKEDFTEESYEDDENNY